MFLDAKKAAFSGLMAALTVVLMYLSSLIESSSLFFIAAASFCIGIVIQKVNLAGGAACYVASVLLNLFVAPNKMYCLTFAAMGLYILLTEWLWKKIADAEVMTNRNQKLWIGKYVIFNVIYIPILWVTKEMMGINVLVLWAAGQVGIFVFDYAYRYVQRMAKETFKFL